MITLQLGGEFEIGFAKGSDTNNDINLEKSFGELMNIAIVNRLRDKIQSCISLLKKL